jgi:hypothetical protein
MKVVTRIALATSLCAIAIPAFAQDSKIVGKWTGKVEMKLDEEKIMAQVPKEQQAQVKSMIKAQMDGLKKMTMNFVFAKDGTYTVKYSGVPSAPGRPAPKDGKGTWKLSGAELTLKGSEGKQEQKGTVKGNKVEFTMPANPQASGKMILTKG